MKILICGDIWNINVLEDDKFERKYGEMLSGVTQVSKKKIDISYDGFSFSTIAHEISHAYYYYSCVDAANLSLEQMEEVFCEIIAIHGENISRLSKKLFKELKKEL